MLYRRFAKAYNWTPGAVRRLRLDELFWLPVIEEAEADCGRADPAGDAGQVRDRTWKGGREWP